MPLRTTLRLAAFALSWGLALAHAPASAADAPPRVRLAADGSASLPVVVAPNASPRVRGAAATLAGYLGRIASAEFEVRDGDGREGIALGLASDFPALGLEPELDADEPARREQYLLRSHPRGLHAVAATELGVEHAVWDLLYRLGHRQFFPGEAWEVVPEVNDLGLAVDANEAPDYVTRRIWFGGGTWDFNEPAHADWRAKNRSGGAFALNTGHAYDGIIRRYGDEFEAHPEYYALVEGRRTGSKLCTSNPGVRDLVVRYARDFFAENPEADSVSVDPSDGGGWCECDDCRGLGSPSDRALTLANDVSELLEREYPGKSVALYAYNFHAPPPSVRARPRVIVSAATAFLKGVTIDEVIDGWKAKGVERFGIREYYGVNAWRVCGCGDYVREVARSRGLATDRVALQCVGQDLFSRGAEAFCADVLAFAAWHPGEPLIIDGIRHVSAADAFSRLVRPLRFRLLYVATEEDDRRTRLEARGALHSGVDEEHPVEAESGEPLHRRADLVVDGAGGVDGVIEDVTRSIFGGR